MLKERGIQILKKNNDFEKNKSEKKKQEKAKKILIVIISVLISIILTATYMFINNKNKEFYINARRR